MCYIIEKGTTNVKMIIRLIFKNLQTCVRGLEGKPEVFTYTWYVCIFKYIVLTQLGVEEIKKLSKV